MADTHTRNETGQPWDTQIFVANIDNYQNWGLTYANIERVQGLLAKYQELNPETYMQGLRLPAIQFLVGIMELENLTFDKLNEAVDRYFQKERPNLNTASMAAIQPFNGRWIMVAGTGDFDVPLDQQRFCQILGRLLAEQGFGLVGGGWQGVDAQVATAFADRLARNDLQAAERLVQLLEPNQQPAVSLGNLEYISHSDWNLAAAERAECLVMIGGKGGTYDVFQHFRRYGKKTIPIGSTGGDAQRAFGQMKNGPDWEILNVAVNTNAQAEEVCALVMRLIQVRDTPTLS